MTEHFFCATVNRRNLIKVTTLVNERKEGCMSAREKEVRSEIELDLSSQTEYIPEIFLSNKTKLTTAVSQPEGYENFVENQSASAKSVGTTNCIDLNGLIDKILFHKQQSEQSFIEMGKLLNEAKTLIGRGNWLRWLSDNIEISPVTAQRYMRLAKMFSNTSPVTHLGYTKAAMLLALREDEIGDFVDEPHEVNGVLKEVCDMSKRELADVINSHRPATKTKASSLKKPMKQAYTIADLCVAPKMEVAEPTDPVDAFYAHLEFVQDGIEDMLGCIEKLEEDTDIRDKLVDELRDLCEKTLESIL